MAVSLENSATLTSGSRRRLSPIPITILGLIAAMIVAVALRVDHHRPTRDIVARVASPDASVVAVLYESSGDAKSSFVYKVAVVADGKLQDVAELSGALRNDRAYGVNLVWLSDDNLSIEYLTAQNQRLTASDLSIGGHHVRVTLHSGVRDKDAPAGGMLFNLQQPPGTGI
jgi:hypothetical protein